MDDILTRLIDRLSEFGSNDVYVHQCIQEISTNHPELLEPALEAIKLRRVHEAKQIAKEANVYFDEDDFLKNIK